MSGEGLILISLWISCDLRDSVGKGSLITTLRQSATCNVHILLLFAIVIHRKVAALASLELSPHT